jgi:hypothetical protein
MDSNKPLLDFASSGFPRTPVTSHLVKGNAERNTANHEGERRYTEGQPRCHGRTLPFGCASEGGSEGQSRRQLSDAIKPQFGGAKWPRCTIP